LERALKTRTGIDGTGAILTSGNAQVDPYRSCLALARAARSHGAALFEHSPAVRIAGDPHGVRIEVERGEIRAAWVIIATGYATPEFTPLAGRFRMMNRPVGHGARLNRADWL
jgi:glycine/D-amino acid oxidase-like deaminating enzyme